MIRRVRARLSYANVSATLALFLALGGGTALALARNSVTTRELAKQAVKGRNVEPGKLKNKHLKDNTVKGTKIDEQSLDAPVPLADSAAAYARVRGGGTVVGALSRDVSSQNINTPSAGVYCFDLPFSPTHVQATARVSGTPDRIATADIPVAPETLPNCPPGSEAEVNLYASGVATLENGGFFVQFAR
jgi:hypothetical protein